MHDRRDHDAPIRVITMGGMRNVRIPTDPIAHSDAIQSPILVCSGSSHARTNRLEIWFNVSFIIN
jgi:hypothetical protein